MEEIAIVCIALAATIGLRYYMTMKREGKIEPIVDPLNQTKKLAVLFFI